MQLKTRPIVTLWSCGRCWFGSTWRTSGSRPTAGTMSSTAAVSWRKWALRTPTLTANPSGNLSCQPSSAQPSTPRGCGSLALEHTQRADTGTQVRAAGLSHLLVPPAHSSLPPNSCPGELCQVNLVSTEPGRRPRGPERPMVSLLEVRTHACTHTHAHTHRTIRGEALGWGLVPQCGSLCLSSTSTFLIRLLLLC